MNNRLLSVIRVCVAVAGLCIADAYTARVDAQSSVVINGRPIVEFPTLRVLRISPSDSGSAGSIITVTFDRPVIGMLGRDIDARRVMSVDPIMEGDFQWRDPATLRFVPQRPFTPGTRIAVAVDTAAIASAEARTGVPYRFSVRIPSATPLLSWVEGGIPYEGRRIGPLPTFRVIYSAPIDMDSLAKIARIEFDAKCGGTVRLKPVRQRAIVRGEGWEFEGAGGYDRDTVADRFRRVVEMEPADSLPSDCAGVWYVAPFDDNRPNDTWRYKIRTQPVFKISHIGTCVNGTDIYRRECNPNDLVISFSVPTHTDSAAKWISVPAGFKQNPVVKAPVNLMHFTGAIKSRDRITISMNSNLRDVYGRRVQGDTIFKLIAPDREPGVFQQIGLTTLVRTPNKAPTITVRAVNVDTLLMEVIPLPDSLIPLVLATRQYNPGVEGAAVANALRDTLRYRVPVHGAFNNETVVPVELPSEIFASRLSTLYSVRFEIASATIAPDSLEAREARRKRAAIDRSRTPIRIVSANQTYSSGYDVGAIVQVTDIIAHSKVAGDVGGVFVTDAYGNALGDATASLIGPNWQHVSAGRTNNDGLALLTTVSRGQRPDFRPAIMRGSPETPIRFLDVKHGSSRLIVPLLAPIGRVTRNDISSSVSFSVNTSSALTHGTVTTDRELYRPGEKLFAKAYVRYGIAGTASAPVGDSVKMSLVFSNGRDTVQTVVDTLGTFGTVSDSMNLPGALRLGRYTLVAQLRVNGVWERAGFATIRVEEFRAPEFLVTAKIDSLWRYLGDTIIVAVDGKYLFGGPMAGMRVLWSAELSPLDGPGKTIPKTEEFSIGSNSWWGDGEGSDHFSAQSTDLLSKNGKLELRIPTSEASLTRPSQVNVSIAVMDANNQAVTTTASAQLQTSSLYIAAKSRSSGWYWKTGVPQEIEAFVVRSTGERVSNVAVNVAVLRRFMTTDSVNGLPSGARHWTADTLLRQTITSAQSSSLIAFTPTTDGAYDIRFEAVDEKGRPARTNIGKWAYDNPPVPRAEDPKIVRVASQHTTGEPFALGDTAQISFVSPYPRASAWITIEREGILQQRKMDVDIGTTTFAVPITPQFAPNMHVGVTLFKRDAGGFSSADSLSQLMRSGSVNLVVDSTAHMLHVSVAALNAQYAPGDTARVRVSVTRKLGDSLNDPVQSEVALWAVDEGLASMTGFSTPNILRAIDQHLEIAQSLGSTLTMLPWSAALGFVRPGTNARVSMVGGSSVGAATSSIAQEQIQSLPVTSIEGVLRVQDRQRPGQVMLRSGSAGPALRSTFRLTAFYVGRAATDSSGVAVVRAKLPDNITTYKLIATAIATGNLYGSGDAKLLSTRQIVMRPSLPRFVRFGDTLWAAAVLNVRNRTSATLATSASVSGATLQGSAKQQITATSATSSMVRYAVAVPERSDADQMQMQFAAIEKASGIGDNVQATIPIRPQGTPRAHTVVGTMKDSATVVIDLPGEIDPTLSTISVSLGSSPIVAMRSSYQRLRDYPYRTSDHIMMLGRSLLALSRAERALGSELVTKDSISVNADLQTAVDELIRRQTPAGTFTYWPNGALTLGGWFTAQVGMFLLDARIEGAQVPQSVTDDVARFVSSELAGYFATVDTVSGSPNERGQRLRAFLGARVVLLQYLRGANQPNVALEDALIKRANVMAWEDRIALADLMSRRPLLVPQAQRILDSAWTAITVAGNRMDFPDSLRGAAAFPSHVRPAARLLVTTMRMSPEHALIGALSETIIQQGRAESAWAWNSQDYGASIEALATLVANQRGTTLANITLRDRDNRAVLKRLISSAATTTTDSVLPLNSLARTADGKTRIAFSLRVESSSSELATSRTVPLYFSATINEVSRARPTTPDMGGIVVERWYENLHDGTPVTEVNEGDVVRVRLRISVPSDRQFVAVEDLLPAGLEAIDLSMHTSSALGPFANNKAPQQNALSRMPWDGPLLQTAFYGGWDNGWWTPWEYKELRDDRVLYFARQLWTGTYSATYAARATTAGKFVRPPAHAEEIYNRALNGRSDGGVFVVNWRP